MQLLLRHAKNIGKVECNILPLFQFIACHAFVAHHPLESLITMHMHYAYTIHSAEKSAWLCFLPEALLQTRNA